MEKIIKTAIMRGTWFWTFEFVPKFSSGNQNHGHMQADKLSKRSES